MFSRRLLEAWDSVRVRLTLSLAAVFFVCTVAAFIFMYHGLNAALLRSVDETLRVNGTAVLSVDEADRALCEDTRRVPKLVIRVAVQACYLHCAKALMRSELWDPAHHQPRSCMPSMGEMLRDQVAHKVTPGTAFENQEQMLERYRETL